MYETLTIVAIFLGLFGFAFGLAGVVGMFNFDRDDKSPAAIADAVLTGSVFRALGDVAENWPKMPEQRRFIYIGIICSVLCILVLAVARRFDTSPEANQPAAGKAGIASRLTIEHHWPDLPEPECKPASS